MKLKLNLSTLPCLTGFFKSEQAVKLKLPANLSRHIMSSSPAEDGSEIRQDSSPPHSVAISTNELFAGTREIFIQHNGEIYRLQITKSEKLILTK